MPLEDGHFGAYNTGAWSIRPARTIGGLMSQSAVRRIAFYLLLALTLSVALTGSV
jgi:hypothetical protein